MFWIEGRSFIIFTSFRREPHSEARAGADLDAEEVVGTDEVIFRHRVHLEGARDVRGLRPRRDVEAARGAAGCIGVTDTDHRSELDVVENGDRETHLAEERTEGGAA